MRAVLSADERERAARFRHEQHARRYVVARGILRHLLGQQLERDPASIRFGYDGAGKPSIAEPPGARLHFNLAHSDDLALYAFTTAGEIGVDVERVMPLPDARDIATNYFSPAEIRELAMAPDEAEAFFRCWTRKEAFIKAIGKGFSYPLDSFSVTLAAGKPAAVVHLADDPAAAGRWSMRHLVPAIGFVGALAVRGDIAAVDCHRWEMPIAR